MGKITINQLVGAWFSTCAFWGFLFFLSFFVIFPPSVLNESVHVDYTQTHTHNASSSHTHTSPALKPVKRVFYLEGILLVMCCRMMGVRWWRDKALFDDIPTAQ